MKLININAWHGGRNLWANLVKFLKSEEPDVLMLQEVADYKSSDADISDHQAQIVTLDL